jgi:hypothetical protein
MDDRLAVDIFDDGGIAARVLQGQVHIGVVTARRHLYHLNVVEQRQRLGHGRGDVERILRPQTRLQAGLGRIARAEVGGLQVKHVGAEAALVQSVGGADAVDRRN